MSIMSIEYNGIFLEWGMYGNIWGIEYSSTADPWFGMILGHISSYYSIVGDAFFLRNDST